MRDCEIDDSVHAHPLPTGTVGNDQKITIIQQKEPVNQQTIKITDGRVVEASALDFAVWQAEAACYSISACLFFANGWRSIAVAAFSSVLDIP